MKAAVLNFEHEVFAQMKRDMDGTLYETLRTMYEKNCDSASITIKVNIELEDGQAPDTAIHTHEAERDIVMPKIEHKVTSSMQIKSEHKGKFGGKGFELVKEGGKFILRPIGPEQASLFDDDREDSDEDAEDNAAGDVGPLRLDPPAVDGLDEQLGGALDGEFVDEDDEYYEEEDDLDAEPDEA